MRNIVLTALLLLAHLIPALAQSERDLVIATLKDYLEGGSASDSVRLTRAFHPSATMKSADPATGQLRDVPIAEYLKRALANQAPQPAIKKNIVSVDLTGNAAQAKLVIDQPSFHLIDYFNLLKIDGRWQVVSKIFTRVEKAPLFAAELLPGNDAFGLSLSTDNQTAWFVKSHGGRESMQLMTTTRLAEGGWSPPRRLLPTSTHKDIDPILSPDGKQLIFNSNRPKPGNPASNDFDIWAMPKTGQGWGEPYHLGNVVNSDSADFYASVAANGNLYFTSGRTGGNGRNDLWRSAFRNGKYQKPENLGEVINTPAHESNPCIAPDESFLIYVADANLTNYGDSDLYVTFRLNGRWSRPQNLGAHINTTAAEFAPTLADGGKTLLFTRMKRGKPLVENIYIFRDFDKIIGQLKETAQF